MLSKICPICANGYNYNAKTCRNCGCIGLSDIINVHIGYTLEGNLLRRQFTFKTPETYPRRKKPDKSTHHMNLWRNITQRIEKLFIKRA